MYVCIGIIPSEVELFGEKEGAQSSDDDHAKGIKGGDKHWAFCLHHQSLHVIRHS